MGKARIISDLGEGKYLVEVLYNRDEVDNKKTALLSDFDNPNASNLAEYLTNNVAEDFEKEVWCIDYTENLVGLVGTIEVTEETANYINIRAGYNSDNADYKASRDGQLNDVLNMTPESCFLNLAILPGVQKFNPAYRYGTITSIDYDSDKADVSLEDIKSTRENKQGQQFSINRYTSLSNVEVEYMECNSKAFENGDDVVIEFTDRDWSKPKIVGFKQEPKECTKSYVILACNQYITVWDAKQNRIAEVEGLSFPCTVLDYYASDFFQTQTQDVFGNQCYFPRSVGITNVLQYTGVANAIPISKIYQWTDGENVYDVTFTMYGYQSERTGSLTNPNAREFGGSYDLTVVPALTGTGQVGEIRTVYEHSGQSDEAVTNNSGALQRTGVYNGSYSITANYKYYIPLSETEINSQNESASGTSQAGQPLYSASGTPGTEYIIDDKLDTLNGVFSSVYSSDFTANSVITQISLYDDSTDFQTRYANDTMVQIYRSQYLQRTLNRVKDEYGNYNIETSYQMQPYNVYCCCNYYADGVENYNPLEQAQNNDFQTAVESLMDYVASQLTLEVDDFTPTVAVGFRK